MRDTLVLIQLFECVADFIHARVAVHIHEGGEFGIRLQMLDRGEQLLLPLRELVLNIIDMTVQFLLEEFLGLDVLLLQLRILIPMSLLDDIL